MYYNLIKKYCLSRKYLTVFITERCPADCPHCFMPEKKIASRDELSSEEWKAVSAGFGSLFLLNITGGEPFIRDDIAEVVAGFSRNCRPHIVTIPTNGYNPPRIHASVKKILELQPHQKLSVDVSIDAIEKEHDQYRSCAGLFSDAVSTVGELNKLKKEHEMLNVGINMTINKYNQSKMRDIYDKVLKMLSPDSVTVLYPRGHVREEGVEVVDIEKYRDICSYISKTRFDGTVLFRNTLYELFSKYRSDLICRISSGEDLSMRCRAGIDNMVIRADGKVMLCEMREELLGDLKQYSFNIRDLLKDRTAASILENVHKTCVMCTHECNLSSAVMSDYRHMIRLALMFIREKFL